MAALSGTVKIPGVGTVPKKYALAGAVITAAIIAVAYWRHRNAPADTAAAATEGSFTDVTAGSATPGGYLGGDTGYYPSGGTPYNPYGYDIYGNPLPAPTGVSGSAGLYSTNLEWENAAAAELGQAAGISEDVARLALSRVLGGLAVTETQRDIFEQARGLLGQPPQGYPTPIKLTATSSSGPGTTPVTGKPARVGGLAPQFIGTSQIRIGWNPVPGATGYRVYGQGAKTRQWLGNATGTTFTRTGLKPGTRYCFWVAAFNSAGNGPLSAERCIGTHKK